MERIIAIIRIDSAKLDQELADINRLSRAGYNSINFLIPKVQVLKRNTTRDPEFDEKALLFNYGFIEMPTEYAKRPTALTEIKNTSQLITGYFYKPEKELAFERVKLREREDIESGEFLYFTQLLVKTVNRETVDRLFEVAKTLDVYDDSKGLDVGSYVILQGYPFEGMGALVIANEGKQIKVELLESTMIVKIDRGNVYYSSYLEPALK